VGMAMGQKYDLKFHEVSYFVRNGVYISFCKHHERSIVITLVDDER